MAVIEAVSREECNRVHAALDSRLGEIHESVKDCNSGIENLKGNDIPHLQTEITSLRLKIAKQDWKLYTVIIVSALALGIRIAEIFQVIP